MSLKDKFIGITLLIVGLGFITFGVMMGMKRQTNNIGIYGENNSQVSNMDLNIWNGVYTGENGTITLSRSGVNQLSLAISNITSDNNVGFSSYTLDLNSDKKLIYNDTFMGKTESITIERTDDGIIMQASSTDQESDLNKISSSYTKQSYTYMGWDGVYVANDTTITLAQTESDRVMISINKGFSLYIAEFENVTQETLMKQQEFMGETENIVIKKATDGIVVEASTTDTDGILNGINATYKKTN